MARTHAWSAAPRCTSPGPGPAVFLLAHERAKVAELRRDLAAAGAEVFATRTLPRAAALAIEEEPPPQGTRPEET